MEKTQEAGVIYQDRRHAGQKLAAALKAKGFTGAVVLESPRGGVPVAAEVARALQGELGVVVARKLGAPGVAELAIDTCRTDARRIILYSTSHRQRIRARPEAAKGRSWSQQPQARTARGGGARRSRTALARMTREELEAFMRRPLVAVLTTLRADGVLHATPVWFEYEDGLFYFWVGRDSVKARNLRANPEAAVCIATQEEPYQYVSAHGPCTTWSGDVRQRCLSICRRYYTPQAAEAFVEEDLASGDSIILVMEPRATISEASA